MIHCDEHKIKISGTANDIAVEFLEIMTELVKAGLLDPEKTTAAFLVKDETGNMIDELLNDTSVVTVSKYGGN